MFEEFQDNRDNDTFVGEDSGIVPSLEMAAHDAAVADGLISSSASKASAESKAKRSGLRRGKWTSEEELYANRLIQEFKSGLLPLTDGTTLRTFLSKLLNCDPMRISKKFVGQNCIGKQVFRRKQQDLDKLSADQIEKCRKELAELERRFLERVAQTNRNKAISAVAKPKDAKPADNSAPNSNQWPRTEEGSEGNQQGGFQNGQSFHPNGASTNFSNGLHNSNHTIGSRPAGAIDSHGRHFNPYDQHGNHASYQYGQRHSYDHARPLQGKHRLPSLDVLYSLDGLDMPSSASLDNLHDYHKGHNHVSKHHGDHHDVTTRDSHDGMHSLIGWPSMTSLLNHDEPVDHITEPKLERSGMMSALSSAVLQELQNMTQVNGEYKPKRHLDHVHDTNESSTKRQNSKDIRYDQHSHHMIHVKKEKPLTAEQPYEDVGYSLEDDHAWQLPVNPRSIPLKPPLPVSLSHHSIASLNRPVNPSNSSNNSFADPNKQKNRVPSMSREPSSASLHESGSITVIPSLYEPGTNSARHTPNPIIGSIQGHSVKNSGTYHEKTGIPHNSSVENFWMLVQFGDLPQPENGTLTETLWVNGQNVKVDPSKAGIVSQKQVPAIISPRSNQPDRNYQPLAPQPSSKIDSKTDPRVQTMASNLIAFSNSIERSELQLRASEDSVLAVPSEKVQLTIS